MLCHVFENRKLCRTFVMDDIYRYSYFLNNFHVYDCISHNILENIYAPMTVIMVLNVKKGELGMEEDTTCIVKRKVSE